MSKPHKQLRNLPYKQSLLLCKCYYALEATVVIYQHVSCSRGSKNDILS